MGMVRLGVFGFLALGVIFILVSIYSKSVQKEKLEKRWDSEVKTGDRDAYIKDGMTDYEGSLRKRLIWLIFVIPVLVVGGLLYATNFS